MAHLKLAFESLGNKAKDVQVVMISTDPARDMPQALKDFIEHFDPSFLGLTGTPGKLQRTWIMESAWKGMAKPILLIYL